MKYDRECGGALNGIRQNRKACHAMKRAAICGRQTDGSLRISARTAVKGGWNRKLYAVFACPVSGFL